METKWSHDNTWSVEFTWSHDSIWSHDADPMDMPDHMIFSGQMKLAVLHQTLKILPYIGYLNLNNLFCLFSATHSLFPNFYLPYEQENRIGFPDNVFLSDKSFFQHYIEIADVWIEFPAKFFTVS